MLKLFLFFSRGRLSKSLMTIGLLVVAGVAESMGLATLLPLIRIAMDDDQSDWEPSDLERAVQTWIEGMGIDLTFPSVSLVFLSLLSLKAAAILTAKRRVGYQAARTVTEMRLALLRGLLTARWSYFTQQPIGGLANSFGTEANRTEKAYSNLFLAIQQLVLTFSYVTVASALAWQLVVGAALGGAVMWGLMHGYVVFAGRAGRKQTRVTSSLLARVTDGLQSMRLLKATAQEDAIGPILAANTKDLKRSIKRQVLAKASLTALNEPLIGVFVIALIYYAKVALGMAMAELFVLVFAFARGLSTLNRVQARFQKTSIDASAVMALQEMIERAEANCEENTGTRQARLSQKLELRDVSVHYEDRPVLDHISLEIPVGRVTAILGESGAGKTTLVDTLTALTRPSVGDVYVDDVPMAELDINAWRGQIGFVPQEVLMLNDTLRTNITLGSEASDAEIEEALRAANAWEFVSELPEGLETGTGERGARFSGGQRSRLALARALLRKPSLLILDEATASLDGPSERAIWDALEALRGKMTIVAISHQPHLATVADRIYRIDNGHVSLEQASAEERKSDVRSIVR
jgi:ATP-binding cassette subfamily C protein